jgi:tetratricopeptide (TPR) repeat protein
VTIIYIAPVEFLIALAVSNFCWAAAPPATDSAFATVQRGDAHFAAGKYVRAVEAYTAAIEAGDASVDCLSKRAKAYLYAKKPNFAIADANRMISLDPNNAEAFHLRGAAHRILEEYHNAISDLDRAISLRPTALSFNLRGTTYTQMKDYDAAMRDYSEAIRLDPKRAHTYVNRANVYRRKRDFVRALDDLSNAIRLDPTISAAYGLRSQVYAAMGRDEEAKADRDRAAELREKQKVTTENGSQSTCR